MAVIDARSFVRWVDEEFEPSVRVTPRFGHYARQPGVEAIDLYGVADMACVLHTIGHPAPTGPERADWADAFGSFQVDGGWFVEREPTHDRLHSTAFALAAMDLVGLRPRVPLSFTADHIDPATVEPFLATIDWHGDVYMGSHRGAGLASIMALGGLGGPRWFEAWFTDLDRRFDPASGLLGQGKPAEGDIDQVGGTFHYHFFYEWHHRRMPFPDARIDAVLGLQQPDGLWSHDSPLWVTLDAVYLLTRSVERGGHRRADVEAAVTAALAALDGHVLAPDRRDEHFGWYLGAHSLTAATAILAEAQRFLGAHEVRTDRPLRLVLDRRPFI